MEFGTVAAWDSDEGWGVLDSSVTPGGCWVGFSVIEMDGYRELQVGSAVLFEFEAGRQDGYDFRATAVWPDGELPTGEPVESQGPSSAYRSTLTITLEDGRVLVDEEAHAWASDVTNDPPE